MSLAKDLHLAWITLIHPLLRLPIPPQRHNKNRQQHMNYPQELNPTSLSLFAAVYQSLIKTMREISSLQIVFVEVLFPNLSTLS